MNVQLTYAEALALLNMAYKVAEAKKQRSLKFVKRYKRLAEDLGKERLDSHLKDRMDLAQAASQREGAPDEDQIAAFDEWVKDHNEALHDFSLRPLTQQYLQEQAYCLEDWDGDALTLASALDKVGIEAGPDDDDAAE